MRCSLLLFPLAALALAACGTDPDSLNKGFDRQNKYAQARFLALIPQPQTFSAFVSTGEEVPTVFTLSSPNGLVTSFKQQVVGEWNGYVSKETATAASSKATVVEGEHWTAVLASSAPADATVQPTLNWFVEDLTPGSQAKVRFIAGFSGLDASVKIGATTLPSPFTAGTPGAWQEFAAGTVTIEITPTGGSPITFPGVTVANGDLWTFGLVADSATAWRLVTYHEGDAQTQVQNPTN